MKQAVLYLHDTCSYSCSYCILNQSWFQRRSESKAATPQGREAITKFFRNHPGWRIILTGGEPTELPGFVELARELAGNNTLALDTNNSMAGEKLEAFVQAVPPERVDFIRCSLHGVEGERLEQWLSRVKFLRNSGYKAFVTWVAVPDKLGILPTFRKGFLEEEIPFAVSPLITDKYPGAYSAEEREILDQYISSAVFRVQLDNATRQTKGKLCSAGHTRIKINGINGEITPCFRAGSPVLGNIYQGEVELFPKLKPCSWDNCSWCFEPHLELEDVFRQDLDSILAGGQKYNLELYKQISACS